jgi:uncharacterized membrane protein YdjX (TVP38/TMEM64 family)
LVDFVRNLNDTSLSGLIFLTALFAVSANIFVPRSMMCVAAGIVYGLPAVLFSVVGSTLGGVLGFWLARYLFREPLERAARNRPKWQALLRAVDEEGWRIVGLFRLGVPIPGTIQNYLFGLTRIGIWPYILATLLGVVPQSLLFVYLGAVGRMTLSGPSWLGNLVLMLIGGGIMAFVMVRVTAKTRAVLAENMAARGSPSGAANLASQVGVKRC